MNSKALAPVVALVLLLGAACSNGDDDDTAQAESILDDQGDAGSESTGGEETTDTTSDEASSGDEDRNTEPLGTARAQLPADAIDQRMVPLRLDVMNLERSGDLIELEMLLTNEGDPAADDPPFSPWDVFGENPNISQVDLSGVGLIEPGEQKLYLPAFDSEDRCLCTDGLGAVEVPAGESLSLNATFGGVPDDADTLDVRAPSFPAITGIGVEG